MSASVAPVEVPGLRLGKTALVRYGGSGSSAYSSTTAPTSVWKELRADAELRGQVEDALDSLTLLVAAAVELRVVLELLAAGIDADVRLVPARPDAAGKWLFVEVYPSNVHTPTPEDRAELELVQIVNQDVRIRADFDGRVYLTAGRGEDTCVVP